MSYQLIYILLNVLVCSIAEYFWEVRRIGDEPMGRVQMQIFVEQTVRVSNTTHQNAL